MKNLATKTQLDAAIKMIITFTLIASAPLLLQSCAKTTDDNNSLKYETNFQSLPITDLHTKIMQLIELDNVPAAEQATELNIRKARILHNWILGEESRKETRDGLISEGETGVQLDVATEDRHMNLVRSVVNNASADSDNPKILSVISVKSDFPGASLQDTLDQAYWRYNNLR